METPQVEIRSKDNGTQGEYLAVDSSGAQAGKLSWTLRDGARDAEHTIVPANMRGKGVAAKLVHALVRDARSEGFDIIPTCSYVATQFQRHPEWAELRA